jgi:hypothetical protein
MSTCTMSPRLLTFKWRALVAGVIFLATQPVAAQDRSSTPGNTYAFIATLPDWSGAWVV